MTKRKRLGDITKTISPENEKKPGQRASTNLHENKGRSSVVNAFTSSSKQSIKEVDPQDCVVFGYNDREFNLLTQSDVQDLIDGFMDPRIGQLQAVIARNAPQDSKHKYEIIAGSRRLKTALWIVENTSIEFKLKIVLHKLTDVEALKVMREENNYEEPSAYERAFATKRQIENIFENNQAKYCETMEVNAATINHLLAFTQIPPEILDAYSSRKEIPLKHPVKIRAELSKHKDSTKYKDAMLKAAKVLANLKEKPASPAVLKQLMKAANDATITAKPKEAKKTNLKIGADKKGIEVTVSKTGITTIRLNKACNNNMKEAKTTLERYLEEHFKE